MLTVLTAAGLTTKDVTLVNLQPAEALAAFTSGSVDAWDIWPPYVQQAVAQDGAKVLARGSQYGSPYSYEVASKSAVANPAKAAAIQVYLATLDKAYVWAEKDPDAWGAAWAAATGLPASITNVAATVDETTPVVVNSTITNSEQKLVSQFYQAGLIPSQPNMSQYTTSQFQLVGQRRLTPLDPTPASTRPRTSLNPTEPTSARLRTRPSAPCLMAGFTHVTQETSTKIIYSKSMAELPL